MEASQDHHHHTPSFTKDDNVSQECKSLISSLPSDKSFLGLDLFNYQGFWYSPNTLQAVLNFQKHFQPRDTDIFLASFPKSGTTWLKALAFAVVHRNKYAADLESHPLLFDNPHNLVRFLELDLYDKKHLPDLEELPSPRLFGTHMPFQALHESSLGDLSCCNKVVYVCRNIKDALVSRWLFRNKAFTNKEVLSLEGTFNDFIKGVYWFGPFWDHVLSYWKASLENPNQVLFMRYEEMKEKPEAQVMRLAEFLGCSFTKEEMQSGIVKKILELCSIGNLSNLEANKTGTSNFGISHDAFFRKGEVGDWKNHLTLDMVKKLDEIVEMKLQGSGLKFE